MTDKPTLKGKIAQIVFDSRLGYSKDGLCNWETCSEERLKEKARKYTEQILSLIKSHLKPLTDEEICKAWLAKAEKAQPEMSSHEALRRIILEYDPDYLDGASDSDFEQFIVAIQSYFHQQQEKLVREIESHKKVGALGDEIVYLGFWYQLLKADILKGGK